MRARASYRLVAEISLLHDLLRGQFITQFITNPPLSASMARISTHIIPYLQELSFPRLPAAAFIAPSQQVRMPGGALAATWHSSSRAGQEVAR